MSDHIDGLAKNKEIDFGKNYLFSKEATRLIIENYDDLAIKSEFLSYLVENLSSYVESDETIYVDKFLFPGEPSALSADLVKKILHMKNGILYEYYCSKLFFLAEDYTGAVASSLKINPMLKPKDLRRFYSGPLKDYLANSPLRKIENFYARVAQSFKVFNTDIFTSDFYINFFIPIVKTKFPEMETGTRATLGASCDFIRKYPELRYDRTARALLTADELLNAKDDYYAYDEDVLYEVQDYVETVLMNDRILDFNLIYFCSYFDRRVDYKNCLNLIVNISEGAKTISLSRAKYESVRAKTINDSLNYLEWILINHHKDAMGEDFRAAVKDFINFNWHVFNANNKSLINLKCVLRNYKYLDEVLEEVRNGQVAGFAAWCVKYGPFAVSLTASAALFAGACYVGFTFLSEYLSGVESRFILIVIILLLIIIAGFMAILTLIERD
jgi:hypothetical protein